MAGGRMSRSGGTGRRGGGSRGGGGVSRMPPQLRESYLTGKASTKIAWGSGGQFDRCVAEAKHHNIPARMRKGMCARLYAQRNGVWPGRHNGGRH